MSTQSWWSPTPEDVVDEGDAWRWAVAISKASTVAEVARAVAHHGGAAAGGATADLAVIDADSERMRFVHSTALDPGIAGRWGRIAASGPVPAHESILTGQPVLLGSPEAIEEHYPHLSGVLSAMSMRATAAWPLHATSGEILGAVGFGWAEPQPFGAVQVHRLGLIAEMAAASLERVLPYDREPAELTSRERVQARLLQDAFLPRVLPQAANVELAAAYVPARDAPMGGDWYDIFPVDGGVCLVIGDVAGHGLQAAAMMVQLRNAVRAFADEDPAPERVLTRLNRMIARLEPGETATAIVAFWDPAAGEIVRSSAGHPPVLRCRKGETGFLSPAGHGPILGADPAVTYVAETKVLRPGTTLLFYTDGLIETRGRSLDDGMNELQAFVEGLSDLAPQAVCDQVLEWRLAAPRREDDLCLLAVRLG
jgi:serine phosphatase RsbU (regulator of sigma subunit)